VCSIYIVLHQDKPFLKHLELKTCGWPNGRHSENFHCRVWARIKILVSSYKSYDHMSPLEGRVLHIDYMFIHLSCMYHKEKEVPRPSFATPDWTKMMGNEERGQREAHCQKKVESIKGEVARLTPAWTSVEHQIEVYTVFYGNTACPCPIEVAPLLFTHEQQQQCLQSSINDNLCSCSVALLIVHRLHIFQWHQITARLRCVVC